MNPTLQDKDIILLVKTGDMKTGDLCGFYWQNKLLLKRVIGLPGDVITLDEDGVVTVNGQTLDEPYVDELALGECDIKFPYQVPENRYFVLGDHRATSIDSRSSVIGSVEKSQIVGKVFLRVWPLSGFFADVLGGLSRRGRYYFVTADGTAITLTALVWRICRVCRCRRQGCTLLTQRQDHSCAVCGPDKEIKSKI